MDETAMNRKEAVYHLQAIKKKFEKEHMETEAQALDMAIKALKEQEGKL